MVPTLHTGYNTDWHGGVKWGEGAVKFRQRGCGPRSRAAMADQTRATPPNCGDLPVFEHGCADLAGVPELELVGRPAANSD